VNSSAGKRDVFALGLVVLSLSDVMLPQDVCSLALAVSNGLAIRRYTSGKHIKPSKSRFLIHPEHSDLENSHHMIATERVEEIL
jgi:hypothetical protein